MKNLTVTICTLLLTVFVSKANIFVSTKLITGQVFSDETEMGIPGVSIEVIGFEAGSISNAEGKFALLVPLEAKKLSFSMNGYYKEEIAINNTTKELIVALSHKDEFIATSHNRVQNIYSGTDNNALYGCIWDDMDRDEDWEDFIHLLIDEGHDKVENKWGIFVENRLTIFIENENKKAIPNATVNLFSKKGKLLWKTITDQEGKAEMWPDLFELRETDRYKAVVEYNNKQQQFKSIKAGMGVYHLVLKDEPQQIKQAADIVLTGTLKESTTSDLSKIHHIIKGTIEKLPLANDMSLSSVFYQNYDPNGLDQDAIKSFEYTNKVSTIDAGFEYALARLVEMYEWSNSKQARILFWAVDEIASPKFSNKTLIHSTVKQAAAKGIQIVPIVTKSIDKEAEFFLRFVANATNGEYIFLTEKSNTNYIIPSVGEVKAKSFSTLIEDYLRKELGIKAL